MSFKYEKRINYYETDKMGVVHHSNYIRFLEESRCAWMRKLGIPMKYLEKHGYTIPVLEVNCKYKFHVSVDDIIVITPKITAYNGVRMTVSYDVINKETGQVVIEATTKHCFTTTDIKPVNMKKHNEKINKVFEKLLNEE